MLAIVLFLVAFFASSIGAVVGATYPIQIKELREIMPKTYFLIPGYGAQGGKAEDIALGFKYGIGQPKPCEEFMKR